jgi:hypothetical protein
LRGQPKSGSALGVSAQTAFKFVKAVMRKATAAGTAIYMLLVGYCPFVAWAISGWTIFPIGKYNSLALYLAIWDAIRLVAVFVCGAFSALVALGSSYPSKTA